MGCGGSKQQDVAAGNTITLRALRGSSSADKGRDPDSSSEEFFSSRREVVEGLDAVAAATEVADDLYLADNTDTAAISNKESSTSAEIAVHHEDNGKSIGNLSVDFKEAISKDEKEAEAPTTENKITREKENSAENKTQ